MVKRQEDVPPYTWVRHEANIGRVTEYVIGQHKRFVPVRWLPTGGSPERSFVEVEPVLADIASLEPISEPQLGRIEAAAYVGMTPTNLYRAKRDGWFGGPARQPFHATPTELDNYLRAPKPRSGAEAAALVRQHQELGRIITDAKLKEYRKRLAGGTHSRRRKGKTKTSTRG